PHHHAWAEGGDQRHANTHKHGECSNRSSSPFTNNDNDADRCTNRDQRPNKYATTFAHAAPNGHQCAADRDSQTTANRDSDASSPTNRDVYSSASANCHIN